MAGANDITYEYKGLKFTLKYYISKRGQRWFTLFLEDLELYPNPVTEQEAIELCQIYYVENCRKPRRRSKIHEIENSKIKTRRRKEESRNHEIRNSEREKRRESDNLKKHISYDLMQIDNFLEFTEPVMDLSDFFCKKC